MDNLDKSKSNQSAIISWNGRGIRQKQFFLEQLAKEQNPMCIALQETKLKSSPNIKVRNFNFIHRHFVTDSIAHGGVGFLLNKKMMYRELTLNTSLQAIAIQARLHKRLTICNIYIPPLPKHHDLTVKDLENIARQLPTPFIMIGDFNGHNTLWHDQGTDARGKIIEKFVVDNNLCILDKDEFTFFRGSTRTHPDLTIVSPEIFADLDWTTLDDPGGSDHVPISVSVSKIDKAPEKTTWNWKAAKWEKYRKLAVFNKPITDFTDVNDLTKYVVDKISEAAKMSIGTITHGGSKPSKPWWNEKCKIAVKNKKAAYRKLKRKYTIENDIAYKRANAIAVRVTRESQQKNWEEFLKTINETTPTRKIWKNIERIRGKRKTNRVSSILKDGQVIDEGKEIANAIAENYSDISKGKISPPNFKKVRKKNEKRIDFTGRSYKVYNTGITMSELKTVLAKAKESAPGADDIPYILVKNLSEGSLQYILCLYNKIFKEHSFPKLWKEAIVIPILKQDKNPESCESYRPIALISCLSKILENILNNRLMWFLENYGFLHKSQCGNRRGHSTIDHLTTMTTNMQESIVNQKYHVSVFLDIEKAYDTCWNQLVLRQLQKFKMIGHLPIYIQNFLTDRKIRVRVNDSVSDAFDLDLGVPQGSSLSGTLFLIAINTATEFLGSDIEKSLFVDDMSISLSGTNLAAVNKRLQHALNQLAKFSDFSGFKFSEKKCEVLICSRKIGMDPSVKLVLNGHSLPIVKEKKFLGLIFDSRLTWIPHIKYIKEECFKISQFIENNRLR